MHAFSLYRYGVCIYNGSGGKLRFLFEKLRDLWHCIFRHRFCFLGASYRNLFYDRSSLGSLGDGFAHGGELLFAILIVVG